MIDPNVVKVTSVITKYEDKGDYPYFWSIFVWKDDKWMMSGLGSWTRTPEDAREEIVVTMAQYRMREVYVRNVTGQ